MVGITIKFICYANGGHLRIVLSMEIPWEANKS